MKTINDIKEELGITSSTTVEQLLTLSNQYKVFSQAEINNIKAISVLPMANNVKNKADELKQRFTDIVLNETKGQVHSVNVRIVIILELLERLSAIVSACAKTTDSTQTITASKIKSGSIQYNTAYPSNNTDIKTNWFYGSSTDETYIHKDVYLPRRGDGQWYGRYGNGYRSYVQFNEDTRTASSNNTTGFGVGLNGGRNSNIKPDVQLIPAFRYDSSYLAKGYAELPDDPIVLFRPGFAFTTKGHINPLDNPNTWFGFETDSNDDTKKSVKIKTAEASLEVDSEGVKANDSLVVTQADIVDNLITNDATKVLSAKQGSLLKGSIVILDSTKASKNGSSTEDFSAKKLTVYGDNNTIGVDGAVVFRSTGGTGSSGNKAYFRAQSSSNQNYLTEYNEGSIYRRAQTGPSTYSAFTYTFPSKSGTFAMTSDVSALETKVNNLSSVQNVADIVATKSALDALTTTNFEQYDKVQVIADETHDGASTIYEWTGSAWSYVGAYGGNTYTKTQTDALLNEKADKSTTYTKTETVEQIDSHKLISKTYSELVTLKSNSGLISGQYYRITDYVTKTNGTVNGNLGIARSVEHPFDIIVTATSANTLSEEAFAVQHSEDSYFANSDLSVWKLWYCLDNDTDRFEWADTSTGKGVIYRMIDEFGNDLPYDFKNIQFKRYKITATTDSRQSSLVGLYLGVEGCRGCTYDSTDFVWRYTFNRRSNHADLSLTATHQSTIANSYYVKEVVIGTYLTDNGAYRCKQALNDIVITSSNIIIDVKMGTDSCFNTWNGNADITYNYFGPMCRRNIMIGEIVHIETRECFQDNIIGTSTLSDNALRWFSCQNHFERNIVIKCFNSVIDTKCYDNVFPDIFSGTNVSGGIFTDNNFGGLTQISNSKFGFAVGNTFTGTLFDAMDFTYLSHCTITIQNFLGSRVAREEYVSLLQGSTNLNVMNLTVDSLFGSVGSPLTITLSDLTNAGNPCSKHLGYAKAKSQNRVLSYTWEEVDESNGTNLVRNNSGKMISADYGSTWKQISGTNVYEIRYADVAETQDEDDKLRITNARLNNAIKNQELLTINESVFEDLSQYSLLYYALDGVSEIIFYPDGYHSSTIKYTAFGGSHNTRITLTFSLYRDEYYLIDEFTVEPLQRVYLLSTRDVSYDNDYGYLYVNDVVLKHLILSGNIDLQFEDEIFDGVQGYDDIYGIMYSSSVYNLEDADTEGGNFIYLYNDGIQLNPMHLFVNNDRLYIDYDVTPTSLEPTIKKQHNINGHFLKSGTDVYYNLTLPGDSNDESFTTFDDVVMRLLSVAQDIEYPCTGYIPIVTPTTNGTVTTYGMISSIKAYKQSNTRRAKFTYYYADTNGLQKMTFDSNTTGTTDDITDDIYSY